MDIFGNSVLSARNLKWLCDSLALILPYLFLQKKSNYINNLNWLSIGFLIMGSGILKFLSSDTTTLLFLSVITIISIKITTNTSLISILLLCIFSSLATASRFPNILIFPLVSVIIYISYKIRNEKSYMTFIHISIYIILGLILYYAIIKLISGCDNFINFAIDGIQNHKMGDSHKIGALLHNYKKAIIKAMGYLSIISIAVIILYKINIKYHNKILLITSCIVLFVSFRLITVDDLKIYWMILYPFIIITLFIGGTLMHNNPINKNNVLICIIIISIGFINIAGSDTGVIKLFCYFSAFTPIILINNKRIFSNTIKKYFGVTVLLFGCYVHFWSYTPSSFEYIDSVYTRNILYKKDICEIYNSVINDLKKFNYKDNSIFYGLRGHLFYYTTNTKPLYDYSYWMYKDDTKEQNIILDLLSRNSNLLFIDLSKIDSREFIEKMKIIQYEPVITNKYYIIYKHK